MQFTGAILLHLLSFGQPESVRSWRIWMQRAVAMPNGVIRVNEPLCCPKCGTKLDIELLEVELEGSDERLFVVRCSTGDYQAAATEARVNQAIAAAMFEYLKCSPPNQRNSTP